MRLFDVPENFNTKRRKPLFKVPIYENGEIFVFWKRAWNEAQAKKLSAIEHNRNKGFCDESFVKFGKVKEMKEKNKRR